MESLYRRYRFPPEIINHGLGRGCSKGCGTSNRNCEIRCIPTSMAGARVKACSREISARDLARIQSALEEAAALSSHARGKDTSVSALRVCADDSLLVIEGLKRRFSGQALRLESHVRPRSARVTLGCKSAYAYIVIEFWAIRFAPISRGLCVPAPTSGVCTWRLVRRCRAFSCRVRRTRDFADAARLGSSPDAALAG